MGLFSFLIDIKVICISLFSFSSVLICIYLQLIILVF